MFPQRPWKAGGDFAEPPKLASTTDSEFKIQFSSVSLTPRKLVTVRNQLLQIIDPTTDSLRIYFLGHDWNHRVEHHGAKPSFDPHGPLVA